MMPAYTAVYPVSTPIVLDAPKVIPRLLLSVTSAVIIKVPPFKLIEFATTETGAEPKLVSELIARMPSEIVVPPL
jgi:hypothetical protein